LLAKPTQLNINLSSDRFAMFNKQRDITSEEPGQVMPVIRSSRLSRPPILSLKREPRLSLPKVSRAMLSSSRVNIRLL
jgi:hypothetical protein